MSIMPFTRYDVCYAMLHDKIFCAQLTSSQLDPYALVSVGHGVFPDYMTLNVESVPILFIVGPDFQITVDRFGNWYGAAGGYIGLPGASLTGGYMLQEGIPSEEYTEQFLGGKSIFYSGGAVAGGGLNWGDPGNWSWDVVAVEGGITTPGLSLGAVRGFLIYDNGDQTPWFFQGD